ncbi:MFS transporter [Acidobacteria bacterium AB60]|nr:MFS transporter [Acidobacteria bacterium AB60]
MEPEVETRAAPSPWAVAAVVLCGVCAFLGLYCTQPLLPLLETLFHASKTSVSLTVSAATLGVALSAPFFGALTERLPRKNVIVASLIGVTAPTLLAATAHSIGQLIFWRFLQGLTLPGIYAVVVTYIGEEWPPERMALVMSFYVSGTALGGFLGRLTSGILADSFSWRASFVAIGLFGLAGAAAVAAWLPKGHGRPAPSSSPGALPRFPYQLQELLRSRRLVATFAVGFNVLFSLVGVFTWITFHLSAPPFSLSTTVLSSLFVVYLVGLVVTPTGGFLIGFFGLRAGIAGAIVFSMIGVVLTLAPSLPLVIVGLTMLSSGVFVAQTASQSHLRVASPPEARVTAAGFYLTCYYLGGTAAGSVPGLFWNLGRWRACVAFILVMQAVALIIALIGWRMPAVHDAQPETASF